MNAGIACVITALNPVIIAITGTETGGSKTLGGLRI